MNKKNILRITLSLLLVFHSVIIPINHPFSFLHAFAEEIDTEAPSIPSNLAVQSASATEVEIAWTASYDNFGVFEYDIYRNGIITGTTNDVTFTDTNLTPETKYTYTVKARDMAGNTSDTSNPLEITTGSLTHTGDIEPPSTPTNVTLVSKTDTTAELSWELSTDNIGVTGYDVYCGGITVIEAVYETNYTVTELIPDTEYSFTVKARDAAQNLSEASNELLVKTKLSTPRNIIGETFTTKILMSWDSVVGATSYDIVFQATIN